MTIYLEALKLGGFRSIGEVQKLAPLRRFNFFVGANNSGKSTVLDFLHRHGDKLTDASQKAISLDPLEVHNLSGQTHPIVALGVAKETFNDALKPYEAIQVSPTKNAADFLKATINIGDFA